MSVESKTSSSISFGEILADRPSCEPIRGSSAKELASCYPSMGGFVEITITPPHTVKWLKLSSVGQTKNLLKLFHETCAIVPVTHHVKAQAFIEFHKDGQCHLHGYLDIDPNLKLFPIGCVSDMAKCILSHCPKKYQRLNPKDICGDWARWRSPQGCIQYRYPTDTQKIAEWILYIQKCQ